MHAVTFAGMAASRDMPEYADAFAYARELYHCTQGPRQLCTWDGDTSTEHLIESAD